MKNKILLISLFLFVFACPSVYAKARVKRFPSGTPVTAATQSGDIASGNCVEADASGRLVDSGAGCGGGTETNSLETKTTGIATTEIPIGTAADTVVYAALSGDATMANDGTVTVVNDLHAHTSTSLSGIVNADLSGSAGITGANILDDTIDSADYAAGSIDLEHMSSQSVDSDNIVNATIVVADTAITAGRSLTWATNDMAADAELYTETRCLYLEDPVATDDLKSIFRNSSASNYTLTEIWSASDQTVTFMLQVDDGSPADVDGTDLAPAAGEAEDTALNGDVTLEPNEELDLAITSVADTPTEFQCCWTFTKDD